MTKFQKLILDVRKASDHRNAIVYQRYLPCNGFGDGPIPSDLQEKIDAAEADLAKAKAAVDRYRGVK
jgi:hypothetical protein